MTRRVLAARWLARRCRDDQRQPARRRGWGVVVGVSIDSDRGQVGSRAFNAFVFLPLVMILALVVWGAVSFTAKQGDKRQRT